MYLELVDDAYIFNYYLQILTTNQPLSLNEVTFENLENLEFFENLKYQSVILQISKINHEEALEESLFDDDIQT